MKALSRRRSLALLLAATIFGLEVAIARYATPGSFLRSSVGDILVIALIYFFVRGVTAYSSRAAFIISLTTGFVVEFLQFFHTADRLGILVSFACWPCTALWCDGAELKALATDLRKHPVGVVCTLAVNTTPVGGEGLQFRAD